MWRVAALREASPLRHTSFALRTPLPLAVHVSARYASTQGSNTAHQGEERNERQQQQHEQTSTSYFGSYRNFRQTRQNRQNVHYQTLSMYLDRLPPGIRELLLYSPLLALLYFMLVQARVYYLDDEEPWYHIFLLTRWRYGATNTAGSPVHVSSLLARAPLSDPHVSTAVTKISFAVNMDDGTSAAGSISSVQKGQENVEVQCSGNVDNSTTAQNPRPAEITTALTTATTYHYGAANVHDAARTADGVVPPLVAPFHEVQVLHVLSESVATASPSSKDFSLLKGMKHVEDAEGAAAAKAIAQAHPYGVWRGPLQVLRDPTTNAVVGYSTSAAA